MAAVLPDIEDFGQECSCAECAALCSTIMGRMSLDDAKRLQAHLGGPEELLRNTVFEAVRLGDNPLGVPRPRIQGERVGDFFCMALPTCGPCVFLDPITGCTLTAETGKPTGCRGVYGCAASASDADGPVNQAIVHSWDSPEADVFLKDLDAYRGTDVTHAEALRMQCHKSLTFSNPYGLLALAVHAALTLSTNLMQTQRRAREWGDTHVSVMTKRTLTPMEVRMSHRKHVCRVLREAREEFCKNVAGLSPAGRDLVEAGRKRVRLDILTMLKEIDDGMFDSGAILEDGDFLYIMRSWIQTLTNE